MSTKFDRKIQLLEAELASPDLDDARRARLERRLQGFEDRKQRHLDREAARAAEIQNSQQKRSQRVQSRQTERQIRLNARKNKNN